MVASRQFLTELYEEHLESASFLYEQRRTLFQDPETTWTKIGQFEQRLEAHIDALVIGRELALDVCEQRAAEGDFGELYAAVCVFCRQNRQKSVLAIFDSLDATDVERGAALAEALKHELPKDWTADFATLLESGDAKLAPILARVFGYRRLPDGTALSNAVKRCAAPALPELVWALGRSGYEPAKDRLFDYFRSEEAPARTAAAIALARMGEPLTEDYCIGYARSETWPIRPLGLAGGRAALAALTDGGRQQSEDSLIAIGLLGDPASVPFLITRLADVTLASAAATALQCLTGANLYETVFVADSVDEDELFDSERAKFRQGEIPDRGDGRPFGSNITRLCQDPQIWNQWWLANASSFSDGVRYRNGHPFSPTVLVDMLLAGSTPYLLRESCLEELAIRYRYDPRFEADSPVAQQLSALGEARAWSHSIPQYQQGAYYFAGRLQR